MNLRNNFLFSEDWCEFQIILWFYYFEKFSENFARHNPISTSEPQTNKYMDNDLFEISILFFKIQKKNLLKKIAIKSHSHDP